MAFVPEQPLLVAAGWDTEGDGDPRGLVKLWDSRGGSLHAVVSDFDHAIHDAAVSHDGRLLVTGGGDWDTPDKGGEVKVVELPTGRVLRSLVGLSNTVTGLAISPDGKSIATAGGDVRLWDVESGKERLTVQGLQHWAYCVAFSPDGQTLVTGGGASADELKSGELRLWNAATGEPMARSELIGHSDAVYRVAFSADGATLASGSWDETAIVWNVEQRTVRRIIESRKGPIWTLALSRDGSEFTTPGDDGFMRRWNLETGKELARRSIRGSTNTVRRGQRQCLAVSPDGRTLALGTWANQLKLFDAESLAPTATLADGHTWAISSIAVSPEGGLFATAGWDDTVHLWETATGERVATLSGHEHKVHSVAFSPDAKLLASGSWDHTIKVWDVSNRLEVATLRGHSSEVYSVRFSPNGRWLASATVASQGFGPNAAQVKVPGQIKLWDTQSWQCDATLAGASSAVFSPDGESLVTGSDGEGLIVWNLSTRQRESSIEANSCGGLLVTQALAISPDGKLVAALVDHYSAGIWNVQSGQLLVTLRGHADTIGSLAFSPDGNCVATGGEDLTIRIWDVYSGMERLTLANLPDKVTSLAFTPDGRTLISGTGLTLDTRNMSRPVEVRLWRGATDPEVTAHMAAESARERVAEKHRANESRKKED